MKLSLIIFVCILTSCSLANLDSKRYRLYQLSDMDISLQNYYGNDLKRISPGVVCGNFKMKKNKVGCFQLLVDSRHGKVTKLIYDEFSEDTRIELFEFDPPVDYVFIEKIYDSKLETSDVLSEDEEVILETGQPSLRLVFFEKSAAVFYWKNGAFHKIWTAD